MKKQTIKGIFEWIIAELFTSSNKGLTVQVFIVLLASIRQQSKVGLPECLNVETLKHLNVQAGIHMINYRGDLLKKQTIKQLHH